MLHTVCETVESKQHFTDFCLCKNVLNFCVSYSFQFFCCVWICFEHIFL